MTKTKTVRCKARVRPMIVDPRAVDDTTTKLYVRIGDMKLTAEGSPAGVGRISTMFFDWVRARTNKGSAMLSLPAPER